jgi:excinuclease ABC subunit C
VESEADALLLENNMIKEHQPRYNILLKDDKTYPWIVVKNEPFPRIFSTRTVLKDKSLYFGPYPSVAVMKVVLKLLSDLYMIRTCRYPLTKENIQAGKFKVCLQYHIKRCLGPCEGFQSEEDYNKNIQAAKEILNGNVNHISQQLLSQMKILSAQMKFEEAQRIKEKYDILENYKSKFIVVSPKLNNIDVFSFDENESSVYINYLHIRSGLVVQGYTIEYKKRLNEAKEDLLALGIVELRTRFKSKAKEIILPFIPDMKPDDVHMIVPQRGDKKKLLELSKKNVQQYKLEQLKHAEKLNPEQRTTRVLMTLQKDLHLTELPIQIECFDNSNIQGTNPVSACVVFKRGKPSKKDYRHFNIKTVVGPDDFSSMYETVFRRYKRQSEEHEPLPQLIVIDGGKGQLHAATDALKDLGLYGKIAIVGIAKRLEEIYFPNDSVPLYLDKNSESLKVIQHLRDEAHRFGITFHRLKRSKQQIISELDSIKGIGDIIKTKLLSKYKSVKRIKEAPYPEIVELIGKNKAAVLFKGFNPEDKIEK